MKMFLLLFLSFSMGALSGYSQPKFTLTPLGFVNEDDSAKTYIVIEIPGKSKQELYKAVQVYLNRVYVSPKDVMSTVEPESISANGFAQNAVRRNKMHAFDMDYTVNLEFKDGKIKIEGPSFRLRNVFNGKIQKLWLVRNNDLTGEDLGIWNEAFKLKSELAKEDLEEYFNKYVKKLVEGINQKSDW
jgi:hypothetical protein